MKQYTWRKDYEYDTNLKRMSALKDQVRAKMVALPFVFQEEGGVPACKDLCIDEVRKVVRGFVGAAFPGDDATTESIDDSLEEEVGFELQDEMPHTFFENVVEHHNDGTVLAETHESKRVIEAEALLRESFVYAKGDMPKATSEAVAWLAQEAERGDAEAQVNYGVCYENGCVVERDSRRAVEWYHKAAIQGHPSAQCYLGYCFGEGRGVHRSKAEALRWLEKAAAAGDADAQISLALCYSISNSLLPDANKAFSLFSRAAENGNVEAMCWLGFCYAVGEGTPVSDSKAFYWFSLAASFGHARARYMADTMQAIYAEL